MKKINSKFTFLLKKIFPVFWLFILLTMLIVVLTQKQSIESIIIGSMMTFLMAFIGVLVYKCLLSNLIDEVFLDGDVLIFKNSGEQIRLNLTDIIDYKYQRHMNPHKVTLITRQPTKLGKQLMFLAPTTFVPFKKNEGIMKLLEQLNKEKTSGHK